MHTDTPHRVTETQRARAITEKFRHAPRIYFIYQACTTGTGQHLLRGTDHQPTAKLIVAQQEALGYRVTVFCAKPAHCTTRCVYQTGEGDERDVRSAL